MRVFKGKSGKFLVGYSFPQHIGCQDDSSKGMCQSARARLVDSSAHAQHVLGV